MLLALRPGTRGIYNLRGPGELPLSRVWRILGKKPTPVPGPLIHTVLSGLWNSRVTNFPKEELDHLRYICLVDDRRARAELGFKPRYGIEETVRAVYAEW
jgi:UDP-glucose 4-epimerase